MKEHKKAPIYFIFCLSLLLGFIGSQKAKAQFSGEAATMIKIQTAKQSGWHGVTKKLESEHLRFVKKNWERLRRISSAVRRYKRIQVIVSRQVLIVEMHLEAMKRFKLDKNFNLDEKLAINQGYQTLVKESLLLSSELKLILRPNALLMTDAERIAAIDRLDEKMARLYGTTKYYTSQQVAISESRSVSKGERAMIKSLYGIK